MKRFPPSLVTGNENFLYLETKSGTEIRKKVKLLAELLEIDMAEVNSTINSKIRCTINGPAFMVQNDDDGLFTHHAIRIDPTKIGNTWLTALIPGNDAGPGADGNGNIWEKITFSHMYDAGEYTVKIYW